MGKAEIWNFSTSLQFDISQVSAEIFHILEAIWRRKIVKMVNLGKEIENEKKLICSTSLVGHRMLRPLSLTICHGFKKNAEKHVVHG